MVGGWGRRLNGSTKRSGKRRGGGRAVHTCVHNRPLPSSALTSASHAYEPSYTASETKRLRVRV